MSGFGDKSLNISFEENIFNRIISHVIKCSNEMKNTCIATGNGLFNHENKITNRLVEKHLNVDQNDFLFDSQAPENYNPDTDEYKGFADIRVRNKNRFNNSKDYYIIECKRIDGESTLNKKYITEGVVRFVGNPPKYLSPNKKNIMFGYVVKAIDVPKNTIKIEKFQKKLLAEIITGNFLLIVNHCMEYYVYSCQYHSGVDSIELRHLFYNFSDAMRN